MRPAKIPAWISVADFVAALGLLLLAILLGELGGFLLVVPAMFLVVGFIWGHWLGFALMFPLILILSLFVNIFCDMSNNWASHYVHQIHDYWPVLMIIVGIRGVLAAGLASSHDKSNKSLT